MGRLVEGQWLNEWYDTSKTGGRFERHASHFRNWVTPDGAAGPTGKGGFKAEPGRYHLYVSYACPWAHRTLIMRGACQPKLWLNTAKPCHPRWSRWRPIPGAAPSPPVWLNAKS